MPKVGNSGPGVTRMRSASSGRGRMAASRTKGSPGGAGGASRVGQDNGGRGAFSTTRVDGNQRLRAPGRTPAPPARRP